MKRNLTTFLSVAFIMLICTTKSFAQNYGKINYWGKLIPIDQSFFKQTNIEFGPFLVDSRNYKYYDYNDYEKIYADCIEALKDPNSTIIVSESNNLSFSGNMVMPGFGDKKRSKKSTERAINISRQVLLPAIQTFAETYNLTHP